MKSVEILIIAMGNSIHTARWLSLLAQQKNWKICLFSSYTIPFVHYKLTYPENVQCYNMESQIKKYSQICLKHPLRTIRKLLSWDIPGLKAEMVTYLQKRQEEHLVKLISTHDFALINTLHTQTSGALLNSVLPRIPKKIPPWINTIWGSDLFLHQWFPGARGMLSSILSHVDYYWGEGYRDDDLARKLGFAGKFLPPVPAWGGFDLEILDSIKTTPPSSRKTILVKGYQNVVGRANVAFAALERCIELLKGYEIVIFSFENEIVPVLGQVFSGKYGIPVRTLSGSHKEMLEIHASARCAIMLSTSDGLPASFTEAMACGDFPIQSNTSMADEWAVDGETAFFVPPEDPAAVAVAIRKVLTDDSLVDHAAKLNQEKIRKLLNSRKIADKVVQIYQSVIDGKDAEEHSAELS